MFRVCFLLVVLVALGALLLCWWVDPRKGGQGSALLARGSPSDRQLISTSRDVEEKKPQKRRLRRFTMGSEGHPGLLCALEGHKGGAWRVLHPTKSDYPYQEHLEQKILIVLRSVLEDAADDDVIAFHDGHDATVWCDEQEMMALFEEFNADVVVGAESNKMPTDGYEPPSNARFRYPNTGAYMGTRAALSHWLDFASRHADTVNADQESFHYWLMSDPPFRVAIDYDQKLMSNLWNALECAPRDGINPCTGQRTCGVHSNGYGHGPFLRLRGCHG